MWLLLLAAHASELKHVMHSHYNMLDSKHPAFVGAAGQQHTEEPPYPK